MADIERPLHLLSLDGGGIRGLSAIIILKDIIKGVNRGRAADKQLQPWECFDLIGGTNTGGIIAVMLGRLHMTLDECQDAYIDLAKPIFEPKYGRLSGRKAVDFLQANGRFDSAVLETAMKDIIKRQLNDADAPLVDQESFVCAVDSENCNPVFLRSYENTQMSDQLSDQFKIWEACRATSAATTFFEPFKFGKLEMEFVDGGIQYNNPVKIVLQEAKEIWGDRETLLISLETGNCPGLPFTGNLLSIAQRMKDLVTETERIANEFFRTQNSMIGKKLYFRFNVTGLADVGLEEYKRIRRIVSETLAYLQGGEVGLSMRTCIQMLSKPHSEDFMLGTQVRKSDEQAFMQLLYECASDYQSSKDTVSERVKGTCEWALKHPKYVEWEESQNSSLLWVTADPGCGKSVLAKFLVDRLSLSAAKGIICYFFFKDGNEHQSHLHGALCALIYQICYHEPSLIKYTWWQYSSKGRKFIEEINSLWRILLEATSDLASRSQTVTCVIDALDECVEPSRSHFIRKLVSTFEESGRVRDGVFPPKFLITSRPYAEIEILFRPLSTIRLRAEDELVSISKDIEQVIDANTANLKISRRLNTRICNHLKWKLIQKADRTFLWISLLFDLFQASHSLTQEAFRKIIDTTPSNLESLYEAALSKTKDPEDTRKALHIILSAKRPLKLEEVNIALRIRENDSCLDDLDLEPDIKFTLRRLCNVFIRVIKSSVYLVHQTARDFLLKATSRLDGRSTYWKNSIDLLKANHALAESCVFYLLLSDWPNRVQHLVPDGLYQELPEDSTEETTFFDYAACYWFTHDELSRESQSYSLERPLDFFIDKLCNTSEKHFLPWSSYRMMTEEPLLAAAEFGMNSVTKSLLRNSTSRLLKHASKVQQALLITASRGVDTLLPHFFANPKAYPISRSIGCALAGAAEGGYISTVQLLCQLGNAVDPNFPKAEALAVASRNGDCSVVTSLLKWGANVVYPHLAETALEIAANKDRINIVEILLSHGAIVSDNTIIGAARNGPTEVLRILMGHCTFQNLQSSQSVLCQALREASQRGHGLTTQLIMTYSGSYDASNVSRRGLKYAASRNDITSVQILFRLEPEDHGQALIVASRSRSRNVVEFLLRNVRYDLHVLSLALEGAILVFKDSAYFASGDRYLRGPYLGSLELIPYPEELPLERQYPIDERPPIKGLIPRKRGFIHYYQTFSKHQPRHFTKRYSNARLIPIGHNGRDHGYDEVPQMLISEFIRLQAEQDTMELAQEPAPGYENSDIFASETEVTFLPLVCRYQERAVIDLFIQSDPYINMKDSCGITPLLAAVFADDYELCQELLDRNSDPNIYSFYQPRFRADPPKGLCKYGETPFIESPLSAAIEGSNEAIFKLLLRRGANPWLDSYVPNKNRYRLHTSVFASAAKSEIFSNLLEWIQDKDCATPFEVNKKETFSHRTLLHCAARYGNKENVDYLIMQRAEIEAKDADGRRPLHLAAKRFPSRDSLEVVKILVFQGADIVAEDAQGQTPLQLALTCGGENNSTVEFLSNCNKLGFNRLDSSLIKEAYEESKRMKSLRESTNFFS